MLFTSFPSLSSKHFHSSLGSLDHCVTKTSASFTSHNPPSSRDFVAAIQPTGTIYATFWLLTPGMAVVLLRTFPHPCKQTYREPKNASPTAKQTTYSHPPQVARGFGPLRKSSPGISALLFSLPYAISLMILFVNHTRNLGILIPGLPPFPLCPIFRHLRLLPLPLFVVFQLSISTRKTFSNHPVRTAVY